MVCDFERREEAEVIKIMGEELKEVQKFKYLGSMVDSEGGKVAEIAWRISAGCLNWRKCSGMLCDKQIPLRLKRRVYKTGVRPAMINGAECWAISKKEEERLAVTEMGMLSWMCGITRKDRVENGLVRGLVKVLFLPHF